MPKAIQMPATTVFRPLRELKIIKLTIMASPLIAQMTGKIQFTGGRGARGDPRRKFQITQTNPMLATIPPVRIAIPIAAGIWLRDGR